MLPAFLGPLQPLAPIGPAVLPTPLGGGAKSKPLAFVMQPQQETNWCWAATSVSVSRYFNAGSPWTQCSLAAACLATPCCADPQVCNVKFTLDGPLRQTGNLHSGPIPGSDSRNGIELQIDNDRPLCCHIRWSGDGEHFVAIAGYDWNTDDVWIADSLYGQGPVPYDAFVSSYRGSGRWDYTYYTQP